MNPRTPAELEELYAALVRVLDDLNPTQHVAFLAKLALLLGSELGDLPRLVRLIDDATQDLDPR